MRKKIISLMAVACALPILADQVVNLTVVLTSEQVWALSQDWEDYRAADPTNNTLTKVQWFVANSTNQIRAAADRRVRVRSEQLLRNVTERWSTLTPEQRSNVVNTLPPVAP